jgi:hypothetical protein
MMFSRKHFTHTNNETCICAGIFLPCNCPVITGQEAITLTSATLLFFFAGLAEIGGAYRPAMVEGSVSG